VTVKNFAEKYGYRILCLPDANREIQGGYAGDLLSWVMGRLESDHAWVTIMSNVNIVAVAALADPACIILSENVAPDDGVLTRAEQQGVNILATERTTFAVCSELASAL
jgi:hypothetical protein